MAESGIQSMTGFGSAQRETPAGRFLVELRTVNNRFQDIGISLPRELNFLETPLRALLKAGVSRGRVDCSVRYTAAEGLRPTVTLNMELARAYVEELKKLKDLGAAGEPTVQDLVSLTGVFEITAPAADAAAMWAALEPVAEDALAALARERSREGGALAAQLRGLTAQLRNLGEQVAARKDEVLARQRERLAARVQELEAQTGGKLEPGRLEIEVALFADRSDVSEELVRLAAHLERFEALLDGRGGEPAGKNLEFLTQEIGREINTIGSKSRDTAIAAIGLEMKSAAEKIREQVMNIQ